MEVLLIILGIILDIVFLYYVAKKFQFIAEEKGYLNSRPYFWWTFWVMPIGMLMVIALPDRGNSSGAHSTVKHVNTPTIDELPEL